MNIKAPCMEEQHAIACLKRGDLAGLEWLVQSCQVQAVQPAYLIVGDRALAEYLTQAAFLRAAEKISQFDEAWPFKSWFLRIIANAAIKVSRRQQRYVPLDEGAAGGGNVLAAYLQDRNPGPPVEIDLWPGIRARIGEITLSGDVPMKTRLLTHKFAALTAHAALFLAAIILFTPPWADLGAGAVSVLYPCRKRYFPAS